MRICTQAKYPFPRIIVDPQGLIDEKVAGTIHNHLHVAKFKDFILFSRFIQNQVVLIRSASASFHVDEKAECDFVAVVRFEREKCLLCCFCHRNHRLFLPYEIYLRIVCHVEAQPNT